MDFSVNMHYFKPEFSVCNHNILLQGSVFQDFDLGPSFHFMSKKRVTFGNSFS